MKKAGLNLKKLGLVILLLVCLFILLVIVLVKVMLEVILKYKYDIVKDFVRLNV